MKYVAFILLALLVSSCAIFFRFEISETKIAVDNGRLAVHFYTQEDLMELSQSRHVQFRCETNQSEEIFLGELLLDNGRPLRISNAAAEALSLENGHGKAGVAQSVDGQKYIALLYDKISHLKQYSPLACYVIGVAKAPVPFPSSNKLVIELNELDF